MKNLRLRFYLIFIGGMLFTLQAQNSVSIYESGKPIKSYEDNFKNLIDNWNKRNITNADDYEFGDFYFVETISNTSIYNYYRNFFSSDKPIGASTKGRKGEDSKGNKIYEFIITPAYAYSEFYDNRGMDEKIKAILSEDFQKNARARLSEEFNIDSVKLFNYKNHKEFTDTINRSDINLKVYAIESQIQNYNITSLNPISQNYIDLCVNNSKTISDLSIDEARDFVLEYLLIDRISRQIYFNEMVKLGDKVFAMNFNYQGNRYTNYIICSYETKKVIWDYFFSKIQVENRQF